MQYCDCLQRSIYNYPTEDVNYIRDYYSESKLYPRFSNRENRIVTSDTTMDDLVEYCSNKDIKAFDRRSIDSIIAVAMAAKMGNIPLLESLVEKIGINILKTYDQNYFTPLLIVCWETHVPNAIYNIKQLCKGVEKLIEMGADLNTPTSEGYTPLSCSALRADNMPLTNLLIQKNSKITSCFSHIKYHDKNHEFVLAEDIVKLNIDKIEKSRNIHYLLQSAKMDVDSKFSIFPEELITVISHLFCDIMTHEEFKK